MMRLRRTPPTQSWERQIRGPSMMRLKKFPTFSGNPLLIKGELIYEGFLI
jgi:hypothetical protein